MAGKSGLVQASRNECLPHFGHKLRLSERFTQLSKEEVTRPSTMGCHVRDYIHHWATQSVGSAHVDIDAIAKLIALQHSQMYLEHCRVLGIIYRDVAPFYVRGTTGKLVL